MAESISDALDLGLVLRESLSSEEVFLTDNFRSYMSMYPLDEEIRGMMLNFKNDRKYQGINPVQVKADNHNSQMKFSYISLNTLSNEILRPKLRDAIQALGGFYRANRRSDGPDRDRYPKLQDRLRTSLRELLDASDRLSASGEVPSELNRFIGLIYQEFNDDNNVERYLLKASDQNDPNALYTMFIRFKRRGDEAMVKKVGFRFLESLDSPLPDSDDYIKFLTAFFPLLTNSQQYDDVIGIASDWRERKRSTQAFLLSHLGHVLMLKAKHSMYINSNSHMDLAQKVANATELLKESHEYLGLAAERYFYGENVRNFQKRWFDCATYVLRGTSNNQHK